MNWEAEYKKKLVSAEEAAAVIKSDDRVAMGGGISAPTDIVNALCKRYQELENVILFSGITMYGFDFFKAEYRGHISFKSLFLGPLERMTLKAKGNVEPVSYHLSLSDQIGIDARCNVYMVEVSVPDVRGYMSFGPVGCYNSDLMIKLADTVMVQVNKETPFVHGVQNVVHVNEVDYIVEGDHPLTELPEIPISDVEEKIGALIAEQIPDGSTIQLGIGGVANAIGHLLKEKKDLGIHTEMMTDSMMDLAMRGVINGKKKTFFPGKIVAGFVIGSTELYRFVDHNPACLFCPIYFVNNINNIAKNDNFVSINNAITADLTGQCGSESLGHRMYSGTGGQLDFVRGAALSKNGMAFLALPSTAETKNGRVSRIVSTFEPGTVVTTPRSDVHYIVTEFGIADLWLKSVPERVNAMVSIAHPDFRDQLMNEAEAAGLIY